MVLCHGIVLWKILIWLNNSSYMVISGIKKVDLEFDRKCYSIFYIEVIKKEGDFLDRKIRWKKYNINVYDNHKFQHFWVRIYYDKNTFHHFIFLFSYQSISIVSFPEFRLVESKSTLIKL